jgi:hypothetical protein
MSSAFATNLGSTLILAVVLAGCATTEDSGILYAGVNDLYTDRRDTIALSAGDAVASNKMTHMVDPWPRHSANRNIAFNGEKMQTAVERYRTNKVTPPVNATTSSASYQGVAPVVVAPPSGKP